MSRQASTTTESELTYLQIKEWLSARVGTRWAAGVRLPPISALARQLNAGQRNTHRAIRELVAEGALISAPRRGTFVAKAKRVYLPLGQCDGMAELMAQAFIAEMERRAITVTRGPDIRQLDISSIDADATVLIQRDNVDRVTARPGHIVGVIGTQGQTPRMEDDRFDVVSVDQVHGGVLAGRCLRGAGVATACYIGTADLEPEYLQLDADRLAGFEKGIGFKLPPECRLFCKSYAIDSGAEMVSRYLAMRPRPRAVFAVSDDVALGFLLGAKAHGLTAGQDFDLIGFDGQWRGRELQSGSLTTVAVPSEEMGRLGAELLASRLENPDLPPRRVLLGCTLFAGTTVHMSEKSSSGSDA